jgi:hypothetical protein
MIISHWPNHPRNVTPLWNGMTLTLQLIALFDFDCHGSTLAAPLGKGQMDEIICVCHALLTPPSGSPCPEMQQNQNHWHGTGAVHAKPTSCRVHVPMVHYFRKGTPQTLLPSGAVVSLGQGRQAVKPLVYDVGV